MFIRMTVLAGALTGALVAAQFPAYSQQYMQRLGGAVDALERVVADFDTSAASLGLSREQALKEMQGSDFVEKRREDLQRVFDRHAQLSADLAALKGHGPFMRAYLSTHLNDRVVARGAWADFEPALPLSLTSLLFALFGFCCVGAFSAILAFLLGQSKRRASMYA